MERPAAIASPGKAKGIKSRRAYEGQSAEQAKPWTVMGISRAHWYRRRKMALRGTGPCAA
jgi:hypothetical protein